VVRTEIRGRGDPIQLDYRMEKTPGEGAGWKIYNLNVLGVWLVETYRSQFAQEVNAKGIDGLITALAERNKSQRRLQEELIAVLVVPAAADAREAAACSRMLAQALRASGRQAVVDASALAQFDSSALAVLLECRREALALGKTSRSPACRRACASWRLACPSLLPRRRRQSRAFCRPRPRSAKFRPLKWRVPMPAISFQSVSKTYLPPRVAASPRSTA
jgi:anti-anti-sigma regulatory factor